MPEVLRRGGFSDGKTQKETVGNSQLTFIFKNSITAIVIYPASSVLAVVSIPLLIVKFLMHLVVDLVLVGSFLLFMIAFAGVGLASMLVKEDTTDDYLVAGRMHPALAACPLSVLGTPDSCSSDS